VSPHDPPDAPTLPDSGVGASKLRLALYQPDIPQNLGAAIRLAACLGVALDAIEPCGFPLTDAAMKRAALDYGDKAKVCRHGSFAHFRAAPEREAGRLVLIETDGATAFQDFSFSTGDTLILGRESAGSPGDLYEAAQASVRIPMVRGLRSLNVVAAGAIVLTEALRQIGAWEKLS
jgi:tRNA (cytidine/uridine-2'-O-)-methyltransferase